MRSRDYPSRGDIYWAELKPVKGSEQGGFRPVFIVSNNLMNEKAPIVLTIPMTRSDESVKPLPFNIPCPASFLDIDDKIIEALSKRGHYYAKGKDSTLLCNQARAISKERLIAKLGQLNNSTLHNKINIALKDAFALTACKNCFTPLREGGTKCPNPYCKTPYAKKCKCGKTSPLEFNYCPHCGEGI